MPVGHVVIRVAGVAALALTLANCSQNVRGGIDPKYGVRPSPRVVKEGEPVPKGGGREMVGKPYSVAGRTYVPNENSRYSSEGLASWYGSSFHGRLTANGEVFDRASIAAAHTTMPLPSYARVTNLQNGNSMIVRVNDRGPYHANRVMDVSEQAAEALGFRRAGTARVRVEYVGRASVNGSDDSILLATLRTDGTPATLQPRAPTMVAQAAPRQNPPVYRETIAVDRSPEPDDDESVAAESAPEPRGPVQLAALGRPPLPPERPLDLRSIAGVPSRGEGQTVLHAQPARSVAAGLY